MRIMPTIDPASFAKRFISGVTATAQDNAYPQTRGEFTRWTAAVKEWLATEAVKYDSFAIYSGPDQREFLLDLVWWSNGKPSSATLACESEWGNTRYPDHNVVLVAEDFDKLLSFKASFKLMIFDSYSKLDTREATIQELNRYLADYNDHRDNEQYLVIDMSQEPAAWQCKPSVGANLSAISLTSLA